MSYLYSQVSRFNYSINTFSPSLHWRNSATLSHVFTDAERFFQCQFLLHIGYSHCGNLRFSGTRKINSQMGLNFIWIRIDEKTFRFRDITWDAGGVKYTVSASSMYRTLTDVTYYVVWREILPVRLSSSDVEQTSAIAITNRITTFSKILKIIISLPKYLGKQMSHKWLGFFFFSLLCIIIIM